ncbi:2, 3 cyclic phosphodiesterase [Cryphonectria parasitica EP155]|uniref:2, 3 cyclic phosphodiesterase n=1 Tax=Cryphonectria parasitica (strain ATCC 38755 / EP155) TaxID=660469 RepID=A0A9P4XY21_CRYP1|nr:2, 3 cyclic phosphodiesterase [Cryphonectria parasitica EP155]KAF3763447.1 2, 3 cyclic phosphodiesterase [Cryphonectria parasitica EP155]
MPGSSLWLVPPSSHPIHAILAKLISSELPLHLPSASPPPPLFSPHLTLTSNIDPAKYGDDPQGWLNSIPFPSSADVQVIFERVKTEDVFFRRCYISCGWDGVRDTAGIARARGVIGEETVQQETTKWLAEWREAFGPHVSLLYGDMPIDEAKLKEIEQAVQEAGITLSQDKGKSERFDGWDGGIVWLVPTDKDIAEWKPIATRLL